MIIAIDTGGTKTLVAQIDQQGKIKKILRFPTPTNTHEYIIAVQHTITHHFVLKDISAVTVALPGIIKDRVAIWCNNLGWVNFDAQIAFNKIFKNIPVYIENDANLAGLGEVRRLATIPSSCLYITVSTGIGTSIITDGHIDPGLRHSEGGRMKLEFDGVSREWEQFASGKAIYAAYGKFAREITDQQIWNQIADRISRGLLVAIPLMQPDTIIIGGSIGTYYSQYQTQLQNLLLERLPPHIPAPSLQQAQSPEQAVLYGCYFYALDNISH